MNAHYLFDSKDALPFLEVKPASVRDWIDAMNDRVKVVVPHVRGEKVVQLSASSEELELA